MNASTSKPTPPPYVERPGSERILLHRIEQGSGGWVELVLAFDATGRGTVEVVRGRSDGSGRPSLFSVNARELPSVRVALERAADAITARNQARRT